jgi:geranylgeranyl diphosphate synthase type II
LVGGQVDDLAAEFSDGDLGRLERIHRRKTGAMICVSLRLGGIVADADGQYIQALDIYGTKLGLAFQIVDDLLDVRGDESALGKRTRKDAEHGKLTFPAILGVSESKARAEQLAEQACEALDVLRPRTGHLEALAHYVVERNH